MTEKTKSCNLTEDEIWAVQQYHAQQIINCGPNYDAPIERMVYLNKRLKAFSEPDKVEDKPESQPMPANPAAQAPTGWGQ